MADLTKYEQQAKLANNAPLSFTTHPNESPLSDPEIKTALARPWLTAAICKKY